jgi:hypothetical protein
MEENYKTCFMIALYYKRENVSYIKIYVDNIQRLYKNSFIVIVSNESSNIVDIYDTFKNYSNIIIIENTSNSKYELGAFIFGIKWIIDNNKTNDFNFYIFTQDNLILTNKYDFNILINNNIYACPICEFHQNVLFDETGNVYLDKERRQILEPLGLYNCLDKITLCWGCCFITNNEVIPHLFNYIKDIVLTSKIDSEASERYMARILYELNEHRNFNIDGWISYGLPITKYYAKCPDSNDPIFNYNNNQVYFQKKHQNKQ